MKELNIEQKAKAYDEKLDVARHIYADPSVKEEDKYYIEEIFPELTESEGEKIQTELQEMVDLKQGELKPIWHNEDEEPQRGSLILLIMQSGTPIVAKIIEPNHTFNHGERWAYIDDLLEKQGEPKPYASETMNEKEDFDNGFTRMMEKEQKPADKVEPKFKVGDKIYLKPEYRMPDDDTPIADTIHEIIAIDAKHYRFEGSFIFIEDQDKFELVGQKSTDNAKPKFKVGDWIITDKKHIWLVDEDYSTTGYLYRLVAINGKVEVAECEIVDEHARLWTIQDAKDGDVLCCESGWTCLFKALDSHTNTFSSYCFMDSDKWFCNTGSEGHTLDKAFIKAYNGEIHPATKEQCNLLFQKMKEAGYEWNVEKKELKKIHNALEECEIENIEHGKYYYCIKDYFAGGKKQASKGDVVQALRGLPIMALGVKANEYFLPVNSIKQSHAWSEEDENMYRKLHNLIYAVPYCDSRKEFSDWLKSLRSQNTWKPSDEQIMALRWVLNNVPYNKYKEEISGLLDQIKEL